MRIADVVADAIRVPLREPTAFSSRLVTHREYLVVRVESDTGDHGVGYTYAGDSGAAWLRMAVAELIRPLLVGREVEAVHENWETVYRALLLLGRRGGLLRALSAVDIASWDLLSRRAGLPLRRYLGGTAASVPAYASGGYYRTGDPLRSVEDELVFYQGAGFTDFKIKVGRLALQDDLARVRRAREVIGPDGRLALDANNAWRSVAEARRAIDAFSDYDPWWVEEPLLPDDVRGHAELRDLTSVVIATGEIESTRWGFNELIRQRAADILQPDACVAGGISEWLTVASACAAADIPVAPHWHANLHAQLAAATPNCTVIEYFALETDIFNFERLLVEPLAVADGRVLLNDLPGHGVVFDDDALQRFRVP